jgi:hypothetical protein
VRQTTEEKLSPVDPSPSEPRDIASPDRDRPVPSPAFNENEALAQIRAKRQALLLMAASSLFVIALIVGAWLFLRGLF